MKLIFIRHGDPDYSIDSLTEKGKREAQLLVSRIQKENIHSLYCSPLGRARHTAEPFAKTMGLEPEILPFLKEFTGRMQLPQWEKPYLCWDLPLSYMQENPALYDPVAWRGVKEIKEGGVAEEYDRVCEEFDLLLARHGYNREGLFYHAENSNHDTLVLVCHFGITAVLASRLMHCSPYSLFQNAVMLPSSVTTFFTEERKKGEAQFRCCGWGDLSHLYVANEPPSFAARFCECFADDERHE